MTKFYEGDWVRCIDDINGRGGITIGVVYRVIDVTGTDELRLEGIEKPYRYWNAKRFEKVIKTFVIEALER
jgi:hypothetical protein